MLQTTLVIFAFIIIHCIRQPILTQFKNMQFAIADTPKNKDIAVIEKPALQIYPNPAKNKISLLVKGFEAGLAVVKIIDFKGKIVSRDNRLLITNSDEITMFIQLPPGIYFVTVSKNNKMAKKKLIVL